MRGRQAAGYLYYVSFKGITGADRLDASTLSQPLEKLRRHSIVPVAVGFGVKDAESAAAGNERNLAANALDELDVYYLEVPRVINFGLGGAKGETTWTAVMILTYMFALMGIQSSPAFTMLVYSPENVLG